MLFLHFLQKNIKTLFTVFSISFLKKNLCFFFCFLGDYFGLITYVMGLESSPELIWVFFVIFLINFFF